MDVIHSNPDREERVRDREREKGDQAVEKAMMISVSELKTNNRNGSINRQVI
jgi:hypothetical protein